MTNPEFLNRTESIRTAVPDMNNSVNSSRFNSQIYDTGQRAKLHPAGKTPPGSRHCTAAPRCPIVSTFNVLLSVIRARISNVPGDIPCPHACRYAAAERAVRFVGNPPYRLLPFILVSVTRRLRPFARSRTRTEAQRRDGSHRFAVPPVRRCCPSSYQTARTSRKGRLCACDTRSPGYQASCAAHTTFQRPEKT